MRSSTVCLLVLLVTAWPAPSPRAQERPTFSAESEMVVLHVTVKDRRGNWVSGLGADAFTVIEDATPQTIRMFSADDAPATIGLVIDGSGSMLSKRDKVVAAAMAFLQESHGHDEVFAVTFNEHVREAWPPALIGESSLPGLRAVLTHSIGARGQTALFDAVAAALRQAARGRHTRQALVVISDGRDNASATTLTQLVDRAAESNAVIYSVLLNDPVDRDGDSRTLKRLAEATGGEFFSPDKLAHVPAVLEHIAREIRAAYTLAYASTNDEKDGGLRTIAVLARGPEGERLRVRTRTSYRAGSAP